MGFASWQRYCTASSSGHHPNFGALNRGRHLCSAGRPSGWALAHILVYIDFSKAFDVVQHDKLFVKLHAYGIGGVLLQWITAVDKSVYMSHNPNKN